MQSAELSTLWLIHASVNSCWVFHRYKMNKKNLSSKLSRSCSGREDKNIKNFNS